MKQMTQIVLVSLRRPRIYKSQFNFILNRLKKSKYAIETWIFYIDLAYFLTSISYVSLKYLYFVEIGM